MERKYFTLKETAVLSSTAYATVKRDIDRGLLPAYRLGRKYCISAADAEDYAAARRKSAALQGYTVKELLELLPLSYAFLMDEIRCGRLEADKCGRRFIITGEALDRYLEKARI